MEFWALTVERRRGSGSGRWMEQTLKCLLPSGSVSALIQICALIQQKLKSTCHYEVWACCVSLITDQLWDCIAFSLSSARAGHSTLRLWLSSLFKTGSCCSPRLPLPFLSHLCPVGKSSMATHTIGDWGGWRALAKKTMELGIPGGSRCKGSNWVQRAFKTWFLRAPDWASFF